MRRPYIVGHMIRALNPSTTFQRALPRAEQMPDDKDVNVQSFEFRPRVLAGSKTRRVRKHISNAVSNAPGARSVRAVMAEKSVPEVFRHARKIELRRTGRDRRSTFRPRCPASSRPRNGRDHGQRVRDGEDTPSNAFHPEPSKRCPERTNISNPDPNGTPSGGESRGSTAVSERRSARRSEAGPDGKCALLL